MMQTMETMAHQQKGSKLKVIYVLFDIFSVFVVFFFLHSHATTKKKRARAAQFPRYSQHFVCVIQWNGLNMSGGKSSH